MLRKFLLAFAGSLALAGCTPAPQAVPVATPRGGVAAANDPRAAVIGEQIMAQGGNATDAAIAMMLALAVLEPQSTGLGGGGFLMLGSPDGEVEMYDGRETAPAAADGDWFLDAEGSPRDRNAAVLSGLSIGVPGQVALAAEAHARHGNLLWADLFAPAIALARNGFPVTPRLSGSLDSFPQRAARDANGRAMFYGTDGKAPAAGEVVRLPALAETLEMVASEGPKSFYAGPFAEGMALKIALDTPTNAAMTVDDITDYRSIVRDPACTLYRLYRVCTVGPPSSGGYAVLAILKQLEPFDLAALGLHNAQTWHLFVEAQRLAFADREYFIGDPDFVDVPLEGLLDDDYLASRAALIDPDATIAQPLPGEPAGATQKLAIGDSWPEQGTTHFVAVDNLGNMASFTATVEGAFGSGLVHGGFYLNNELTDFDFTPEVDGKPVANRVEGGKRPASSMTPTLVYDPDGAPFFTVGAAGGGLIPAQTARAIIGVIDFGLPLEQALGLPFVMGVGPGAVLVEQGTWMEELAPEFQALGHPRVIPFGQLLRTTGALHTAGGWQARHDPRLDDLVRIPEVVEQEAATEAGFDEGDTLTP
jgi:gamma-glutamyltranspeptidase/glutathione hydrolase